jgi:glycosyltransferase involved in cell wall biosynthesis
MKILIVTQYYYPEQFQINEIAPELVRRGHDVTVLCGVPNYPKGAVFSGYETPEERAEREWEYREQTGVQVVHVEQHPREKNAMGLWRNYCSFARNSKKAVRTLPRDFDVVLGYQLSPISSMYAAAEYKKRTGAPVLFYTLDLWPVSAEAMLKSRWNPLMWPIKRMSKRLYGCADRILVTSRPFVDYLEQEDGVARERLGYLPQHAGDAMLSMDLQKLAQNGCVDFMFAGNMGKGQRLDVVVNAAAELGPRKDYRVHFVGDGSMRSTLETMVREKGLAGNVLFHGNQRREDMPSFYKMADVLLLTLRGNNAVGNTMPGKLQMYMTTGKPILGAINGAANEVIREARCGACVAAGDFKGLAELMRSYIERPELYAECGANARRYFADHFTFAHFMDSLERELLSLAL